MQGPLKRFGARLRGCFRVHPTRAELIACTDGELLPEGQARVEDHLERCSRCKAEALAIEEDLLRFEGLARSVEVGALYEEGLGKLQATLKGGSAQPSLLISGESLPPGVLDSIRTELTIYLGARAAESVLAQARSTTANWQELVDLIEPLMAGLLGNQGGLAVAGRVAQLCAWGSTPGSHSVTR